MSSDFDVLFEQDSLPQAMTTLGESVGYTPVGGSLSTIAAMFSEIGTNAVLFGDGEGSDALASVTIHNDSTLGVVSPAEGDKVTRASEDWFVTGITTSTTAHKLTVKRVTRDEYSHADHVIQR